MKAKNLIGTSTGWPWMESTYLWPRLGRRRFGGGFGRSLDSQRWNFVWNFKCFYSLLFYIGGDISAFCRTRFSSLGQNGEPPRVGRSPAKVDSDRDRMVLTTNLVTLKLVLTTNGPLSVSMHCLWVFQELAQAASWASTPDPCKDERTWHDSSETKIIFLNVYQHDRVLKILLLGITWICWPSARCICGEISRSLLHQADLETLQTLKPLWSVHDQVNWYDSVCLILDHVSVPWIQSLPI